MPNESELERRIRELEEENSRLKSKASRAGEYTAREDNYQGIPMLVFERPSGKPFKLGVSKLQAIRACFHKVEEFLRRHGNHSTPGSPTANHSNDDKI